MNKPIQRDITNSEVKLNWFQRHLNLTYGPLAFVASSIPWPWMLTGYYFQFEVILSGVTVPIIISAGIWVIVSKGRNLWLPIYFALWPTLLAGAISLFSLNAPYYFHGIDTLLIFAKTLIVGVPVNVIIVLALKNKKYKRVVAIENGKSVVRWYKIDKTDSG